MAEPTRREQYRCRSGRMSFTSSRKLSRAADSSLGVADMKAPVSYTIEWTERMRSRTLDRSAASAGLGNGEGNRAVVAGSVDGADAELEVVFGRDRQGVAGDVAHRDGIGPVRRGGLSPHDLVAGEVRIRVGVPGERRAVGERGGDDLYVLRRARPLRQRPQRARVHPGHALDVAEVDEIDQIAELDAVLDANVLVLVGEVLIRLGEARRRVALGLVRDVVARAQVPVAPVDEPHGHVGDLILSDRLDEAAELAR